VLSLPSFLEYAQLLFHTLCSERSTYQPEQIDKRFPGVPQERLMKTEEVTAILFNFYKGFSLKH